MQFKYFYDIFSDLGGQIAVNYQKLVDEPVSEA